MKWRVATTVGRHASARIEFFEFESREAAKAWVDHERASWQSGILFLRHWWVRFEIKAA